MTPTSKKRKSALLQNLVRDKILKSFPHLKPEDVITANNKTVTAKPPYVDLPEFPDDYKANTLGLVNYPHSDPIY